MVVDVATEVFHTVADNQIFGVKYGIVTADLLENALCDGDVWGFVFNDNQGFSVGGGVDYGVATPCNSSYT